METNNESRVPVRKSFGLRDEKVSSGETFSEFSGGGEIKNAETTDSSKKIIASFDFVFKLSMFAIFFGIPLFFTSLSFQGASFDKQIFFYFWTLIALITWASKSGYTGEMKIRKTPLDIPIAAFWLVYLAATIFSVDKWHSFFGFSGDPSRGFLSITAMIVVYYLILSNFNAKLFKWIWKGLLVSGYIIIIRSFVAILGVKFGMSYLPFSLPGSIESLAIFLSAFVPVLIVSIFKIFDNEKMNEKKKLIFSAIHLIALAIDLFLIFALYAYLRWPGFFVGLPGILIGIILFLVFVLSGNIRPKGSWAILPMAVFVTILTFWMIGQVNLSRIELPISVSVPYGTSLAIAKDSLKSNFFIGSGVANYGYAFSKNLPAGFDNMGVRFFQGQGIILESISTIGAVGTILLIVLILTFFGVSLFMLSRDKEKNKIYSLGAITSAVIILANIIMTRAEASVLIYGIILASLSLGILYFESRAEENFVNFSLKASPKFALTLAFIYLLIFASVAFLFVFFGKIYVADLKMGSAVRQDSPSEEGSITKMAQAININPREGKYFIRLGQEYMALTNQEMLKDEKSRNVDKIQSYLTLAIQSGKRGEELMKNDAGTAEALAQIYENAGLYVGDALQLAEEEYNRTRELEPNNPDTLVKLGQIKLKMVALKKDDNEKKQTVEDARDLFQKAIDIRGNYSPAFYNLSLAEEALGDLDKAIENMTNAALAERGNINYVFNLARLYQARAKGDDLKTAESLYKQILGVNDKEINTHFNLALLYEKNNKKAEAVDELNKVLSLLPQGSDQAKAQIQKMISNIQNGVPNTAENLGLNQNQGNTSGQ
jgi:tetratricopeptide (TPR) repeat protein